MLEGIVVRALGGFFFVAAPGGEYRCYLRGRLKRQTEVLVGDHVRIRPLKQETHIIEEVLPRRNRLRRPPVANIDQGVVVASLAYPSMNTNLLDRFLVLVQGAGLLAAVCINKVDLADDKELEKVAAVYRAAGFPVILTSSKTGQGIEELRRVLKGKISVIAGPSGVGKSSLLNRVQPGLSLKTGEVSRKLGRGKHTTRHVELLSLEGGGRVADTPGFTSLDLKGITQRELMYYFPEFVDVVGECRYPACLHWREPDCSVKKAVSAGQVSRDRYEHYVEFLQELEA